MAVYRERPYSQFRYHIVIPDGPDPETDAKAGFQEVSGLGIEVTVAEYRAGNYPFSEPIKITTTAKATDVTLKRGVLGDPKTLYGWLHSVRNGSQDERRDVTVELYAEDGTGPVQEWTLKDARPTKYSGPTLSGKGTDVAIEELTLACERIESPEA